ncbi:MAG: pyrophosphate--fructose-6-phosphate 1-phosphotransferase, partial [Verrucomicrobiae bacterium]|nr:pyrophosphate--fructose-6-phosphate 1-phosphotransferase [Verrucomicrobiae bacterium]
PEIGLSMERRDVHAIFIPEMEVDLKAEAARLKKVMDKHDCVNIFISEGAGVEAIVAEMESKGQEVPRDAFGHVKLDAVNPGKWFGQQFAEMLDAEKVLVQKSGYFARAAAANAEDLRLIKSCTDLAVQVALEGGSGVIGHDEDQNNILRAIEFERIKGGKPFDIDAEWFEDLLDEIG